MHLDVPHGLIVTHLETALGIRANAINSLRREPAALVSSACKGSVVKVEFLHQGVHVWRVHSRREDALATLKALDLEERVFDGLGEVGPAGTG